MSFRYIHVAINHSGVRPPWLHCSASELQTVFYSWQSTQNQNLFPNLTIRNKYIGNEFSTVNDLLYTYFCTHVIYLASWWKVRELYKWEKHSFTLMVSRLYSHGFSCHHPECVFLTNSCFDLPWHYIFIWKFPDDK